jgi:hypothetical protein
MKLHGYNLLVDIAQSEPADIAQVMMKLRDTIVLLLEEGHANRLEPGKHTIATKRAHQIVSDFDAGELLWPGWKAKEKAAP